jgi:hypothetical protein
MYISNGVSKMKKVITAVVVAASLAVSSVPANAWYGGWGYGGWGGGWGYGGYGAGLGIAAGAGLLGGIIGGAIANGAYGYGYGYPAYGYGYAYPAYGYAPQYRRTTIRKNIIIKNSPGAQVIEDEDYFGW